MKKIILIKKIIFLFLIFLPFLKAEAAFLTLFPSQESPGIGEQFYLDVLLNPENESFNGIEARIIFPEKNLKFIRAEESKSMVDLWIDPPRLSGNTIFFSGIMTNGFEGVIDPFNQDHKLPGRIVRIVFETLKSGQLELKASGSLNYNDGLGTVKNIPEAVTYLLVQNIENKIEYQAKSSVPEINAYVVQNPDLFENKCTLVFEVKDAESGIEEVLVKEGNRNWQKAKSPYPLRDLSCQKRIIIQAKNYSGTIGTFEIAGENFQISNWEIVGFIILVLIIFAIIRGVYDKNKKQNRL